MKKTYLCAVAALFLAVLSCSDDDTNIMPTETNNPEEETILDPSTVSQNIIIEGATRVNGDAPQSTGNISFSMSYSSQSAFLKNGFNITFDAPAAYAGAYIQIKSTDEGIADEYFNVPSGFGRSNSKRAKINEGNTEIDVDFEDTVEPGQFCYLICIYDNAGNISDPVEVCVEIEAWGGNTNLIGTWNYTKQVANGVTTPVGEINFCEGPGTVTCNNLETLTVEENEGWCYATSEMKLELNNDGTYTLTDLSFQKQEFIYEQTLSTCTVVNETVNDEFGSRETSTGYWAYNEENRELSLIEFENVTISLDDNSEYSYIEESGYIHQISGVSTNDGTNLVVTGQNFDFDVVTEYHFNK
ncbi:hypothetical protein [Aquimarina rubra]|uniref:Lipocalin-like domain-containing protein n=1 Tax=Aquimarina rubra TaxID=1920033 RepID=A0ABW5LBW1_9FLAO